VAHGGFAPRRIRDTPAYVALLVPATPPLDPARPDDGRDTAAAALERQDAGGSIAAVPTPPSPARRRQGLWAAVAAVVLLALGWVVADQLTAALRISSQPSTAPSEQLVAATVGAPATYDVVRTVVMPSDDPLLQLAARTYADALEARTGTRPAVVVGASGGTDGRTTVVALDKALPLNVGTTNRDQGYRLATQGQVLTVAAQERQGAAAGLFALADTIESGRPLPADGTFAPALGIRMLDSGAVGVEPDPEAWRSGTDYSHNSLAFRDAILTDAPYVDQEALAEDAADFRAFVDHGLQQGYNAIAINGLLEYLTFGGVGSGTDVYAEDDPHRARAIAMRESFGPMLKYAHDMGMQLVLKTDMLALTTPLEQYFDRELGGVDVDDPRLWDVYQAGLHELFQEMPYVDALMVRIGEAGTVYDIPGWDYYSRLAVTTVPSVRSMLTAFTDVAEQDGKDIVFRSWSVGVGDVGDMHTSQKSYAAVLDGIDSPRLVVSTKYSLGDFYSHLPLNDTLEAGDHRRIVELQGRREFEAYGSLPNDLTVLHQEALQRFIAANPEVEGIWLWTQDGGPWRAGPMSLYLKTGFWQLYDLSAYAAGRLAWNPDADASAITADWARRTFSDDPATVAAITTAMAQSREAISKGLYIGPYADLKVKALGLEPPPMMWIFEWDIVTGDSAVLGTVYDTSRGELDRAIAEGPEAVAIAERMRDAVAATDPSTWRSAELRDRFVSTLDYQVDLFTTLAAYRTMVLRHEQWLDTGSSEAKAAWVQARTEYVAARDEHVAAYSGDIDLPAYEFTAADIGLERADRDEPMAWLSRGLLVLLVVLLLLGSRPGQRLLRATPSSDDDGRRRRPVPGSLALRALWVGLTRPWKVPSSEGATRLDRVLVWLIPVLAIVLSRSVYTWFAAPAHLVLVLGAWALFLIVLRLSVRGRDGWMLWAGVGGAAVLRTLVLLVALAPRGPGGYWFSFWTRPESRTLYVVVAFAAFAWVLVAAWLVLRSHYGMTRRGAWGRLLLACAAPLVVLGGLVTVIGLETALTAWNDQMALLPWGLSRILGITTYLGIPTELPVYAVALGVVLAAVGAVLYATSRRRDALA
jgi:hypothetical protein